MPSNRHHSRSRRTWSWFLPRSIREVLAFPHGRSVVLISPPAAASQSVQRLAPSPLHIREDAEEPSIGAIEGVVDMTQRDLVLGADPQLIPNQTRLGLGRSVAERP